MKHAEIVAIAKELPENAFTTETSGIKHTAALSVHWCWEPELALPLDFE